jgi:dihydrofolate synthase / folylpolyglutamate synthase
LQLPDALAWLDRHLDRETLPSIAAGDTGELSLESMRHLCRLLGDPQTAYPVVHVTGTNGKGSVTAMVSALFAASGLSVGTYTSPHLGVVNERLSRNGEPIDDASLAEVLGELAAVETLLDRPPSWFELLTAAALSWFATVAVDVAVVEVGLLGRFDATNVVDAEVSVVTNIGFDHTDGVGDWRVAVASEKAGIIREGGLLVLGETDPALRPVFAAEQPRAMWVAGEDFGATAERHAVGGRVLDFHTPLGRHDDVFVAAHGSHQSDNAAMAVAAVEGFFDRALDESVVAEALGTVSLPGRFEVLGRQPLVVVDGAHNPPAATAVARTLVDEFQVSGRRVLVLGMLAGRDPKAFLNALSAGSFDAVVTCTPPSPRALPASELASVVRSVLDLPVEAVDEPVDAVRRAVDVSEDDDLVLVTGSLYVVGAVRAALR